MIPGVRKLTRDVVCITYPHPVKAGTEVYVTRECRPGTCEAWFHDGATWVAIAVPTDALGDLVG